MNRQIHAALEQVLAKHGAQLDRITWGELPYAGPVKHYMVYFTNASGQKQVRSLIYVINMMGKRSIPFHWDAPLDQYIPLPSEMAVEGETRSPDFNSLADDLSDQMALIRKGSDWDGAFREIESFDPEVKEKKEDE